MQTCLLNFALKLYFLKIIFQNIGTAHGEELPYVLGAPLVDGFSHFPRNYTKSEVALSEAVILYISNFAKTGLVHSNNFMLVH